MLSAVENHFGPNRPYATASHHYASASGSNLLTAPCPIDALPAAMSAAEFARPHPKTTSRLVLEFSKKKKQQTNIVMII